MSLISYYGDIFQIGYVARDLEKAMAFLDKKMGAREFSVREHELTLLADGEERPLTMRVAMANIGNRQIEIIQPVSGATGIYTNGVDYDRSVITFHHLGILIPGPLDAWTKMEEEVRAAGEEFALYFSIDAENDFRLRFAYVDTRADCGHFTEYLWWSPTAQAVASAGVPDLAGR